MLVKDDLIGIICCSDGRKREDKPVIERLKRVLEVEFGLQVILAKTIFEQKIHLLVVALKNERQN